MFNHNELLSLDSLRQDYIILVSNGHDVRLKSHLTGHEWIIISPYDNSSCKILHRHSDRDPLHHQRGNYNSLFSALEYIKQHDIWYYEKAGRNTYKSLKKEHQDYSGALHNWHLVRLSCISVIQVLVTCITASRSISLSFLPSASVFDRGSYDNPSLPCQRQFPARNSSSCSSKGGRNPW